jgi:tetratricopeptide (TPR) repeat protein
MGSLFALEWPSRHLFNLSFITTRLPHLSGAFSINHNQMAGVLVLLLPLAIAGWQSADVRWQRLVTGAACTVLLLTLLLTQSRNVWLALLIATAGILLWRHRRFWPLLLLICLLLLLPFVVAWLPLSDTMWAVLYQLDAGSKAGSMVDQSWLGRVEMWKTALQMMRDYPLLGAGLYSFDAVSRANYIYQAVRPTFPISHAHNLFLQTGAGLGWAGWLAAVLLWLSLLFGLWRASRDAPVRFRPLGQAMGFSLLACLSFNTFDVLALEQRAGLLLWMLLGLASTYIGLWGIQPSRQQRLLQFAPLALLLLLLPTLPRNLAHLRLDHVRLGGDDPQLLDAGQMGGVCRQGVVYYLQGHPDLAQSQWVRDINAPTFLLNQGQQAYLNGQPREALGWYEQALALEPAATTYYWRGAAHGALGQNQMALADYRRVVALAREERVYGVSLAAVAWERQGRLLVDSEQWEQARDAFARAVALAPDAYDYRRQLADVERMLEQLETAP